MKRAGSQWRIGRYLYNLDAGWAKFEDKGRYNSKIDGTYYKWNPPALPKWALPDGEAPKAEKPDKKVDKKPDKAPASDGLITAPQLKKINTMITNALLERIQVKLLLKVASLKDLTQDRASNLIEKWDDFIEVYEERGKQNGK
jgi:hypothetical protein